jgi:hypothetical protein
MAEQTKNQKKDDKKKPASRQELAARYGYAMSFFNSNDELKDLLEKAKKQNWDAANFQAAIRNTTWWKKRSETQRNYDILKAQNPGEHTRQVEARMATLREQAAGLGITATDTWLRSQSETMVRNGATEDEVQALLATTWHKQYLAEGGDRSIDDEAGSASSTIGRLKQAAAAYGYPLGDDTLAQQTLTVLNGTADVDIITEKYKTWAKKQFAAFADDIDAGQSVQDILDPYAQIASQELGIPKGQMLASDPKWQAALTAGITLPEWRTKVRTDAQYGWDSSETAQNQAYQMVAGLQSMFQGG